MESRARELTAKETEGLNTEYNKLIVKLETQTAEQVEYLKKHVTSDKLLSGEKRLYLISLLEHSGFKLKLFRITDANALREQRVQVTYDIHDDLYAYLTQAPSMLPPELRYFLEGGITLDAQTDKPTASDPSPLIGKSKTGIAAYDAILARVKT